MADLPDKRAVADALLAVGNLFVHLDPRVPGVAVPAWLTEQPQLVLQIGLDMPVTIPDLEVGEDGVAGTLSFQRAPHRCVVPWAAVFALVGDDGQGMVWPDDLPVEIAAEVEREAERRARRPGGELAPGPRLAVVEGDGSARVEDPEGGATGKRPLPPYLRVVK